MMNIFRWIIVAFIVLKLTNFIDWNWLIVLIPVYVDVIGIAILEWLKKNKPQYFI